MGLELIVLIPQSFPRIRVDIVTTEMSEIADRLCKQVTCHICCQAKFLNYNFFTDLVKIDNDRTETYLKNMRQK